MARRRKARATGYLTSMRLALEILRGTLQLLRRYPKLALPVVFAFCLVLLVELGLVTVIDRLTYGLALAIFLGISFALMLSFAASSAMLKQIHSGHDPSLLKATLSTRFALMLPGILGLSIVWFSIVLALLVLQAILSIILDRIQDGLAEAVVQAIFGTLADAVRMAGFMVVTIMTFEGVGLWPALSRLRTVVKQQAIAALGGLTLTKLVGAIAFFVLSFLVLVFMDTPYAEGMAMVAVPLVACCWILVMYLEQMFVAGLYLYTEAPDSPVVQIMIDRSLRRQLRQPPATSLR